MFDAYTTLYMNADVLIPLLVTSLITVVSWSAIHFLSKQRDVLNKKKEIRIRYLIDAFRRLESASNKKVAINKDLESVMADIQLFGSKKQIKLAQKFISEMAENQNSSTLELLESLRDVLREELMLDKVSDKFLFLRIENRIVERLP